MQWDVSRDLLIFDVSTVIEQLNVFSPTKRSVVGAVSRFYDPLGILSPVIIVFKMFLQELTKSEMHWDEPLVSPLLEKWKSLIDSLQGNPPLAIPRFYLDLSISDSCYLSGFCDASAATYAAVIYLVISLGDKQQIRFVTSKTRVAHTDTQTIPRLELIGALLFSQLVKTVSQSLEEELPLQETVCYTDSKITFFWIYELDRDWKPFVQNRTEEIRRLVPPFQWRHCPGKGNPADLPSRGSTISELRTNSTWWTTLVC